MRVLVIGNGAREHALVWKLRQSPLVSKLFASPGNAGIALVAECVVPKDRTSSPIEAYASLAQEYDIDLTVVGPEALLVEGIADEFVRRGLAVFGPTAVAAQLEGSKVWAKDLMGRVGIPTASWRHFSDIGAARNHARTEHNWRCAVKADCLAGGKGSFVCRSQAEVEHALAEILVAKRWGTTDAIVEELLDGQEVSVFAITDGETVIPFGAAQDHKRLEDNDGGPNTGGMGAYSPVEHMQVAQDFAGTFFRPLVDALRAEGTPYVGVLYAGAIVTEEGPRILEFNCRFGDPEAQVLLSRLDSDLAELLGAASKGRLHTIDPPRWRFEDALCVVLAAGGYPDTSKLDVPQTITGVDDAAEIDGVLVFHAGTDTDPETGALLAVGGRVLSVTALADSLVEAQSKAYMAVEHIAFKGMQWRTDIAAKAIGTPWDTVWKAEWRKPPRWEESAYRNSEVLRALAGEIGFLMDEGQWSNEEVQSLTRIQGQIYDVVLDLTSPSETARGRLGARERSPKTLGMLNDIREGLQTERVREGIDSWLTGLDSPAARAISDSSDHVA